MASFKLTSENHNHFKAQNGLKKIIGWTLEVFRKMFPETSLGQPHLSGRQKGSVERGHVKERQLLSKIKCRETLSTLFSQGKKH